MSEINAQRLASYLMDYINEDEARGIFDWDEMNLEEAILSYLGIEAIRSYYGEAAE